MMFVSFLFFTVSTFLVHGKETSKDGPVIPKGCEGKTLCDIKPDDYPQEEIDRYLANNPEHLERLKRDVSSGYIMNPKLEDGSRDGNCKITPETKTYFQITNKSVMPYVILQSKYFEQKITQFNCQTVSNSTSQCFQKYIDEPTKCVQKTAETIIHVYDRKTGKVELIKFYINVDCACELT